MQSGKSTWSWRAENVLDLSSRASLCFQTSGKTVVMSVSGGERGTKELLLGQGIMGRTCMTYKDG